MSIHRLTEFLRCPYCANGFDYRRIENGDDQSEYGILKCTCFEYPVVDGVPIILQGHVGLLGVGGDFESKGADVREIVGLIAKRQGLEALIRCLSFTPHFDVLSSLPGWRLWNTGVVPAAGHRWIEHRLRRMLTRDRHRLAAEDWFSFFFDGPAPTLEGLLPYYRNRFVLPRTLAAFSVLRLLPSTDKPVLDVACGYGPTPHYLSRRPQPARAVGIDFNFYLVWAQQHWIAPRASFICADAGKRLPFADGSFSAIACMDAFMYLPDKPFVLAEFDRCAPGEPVVLSRVGNKGVSPKEMWGDSFDAEGYMQLFAKFEPRVFSDYALVRHYLARRNPLAGAPTDPKELRWDKWLHFVLNGRSLEEATVNEGEEWPHQVGVLTLNPIFERKPAGGSKQKLTLRFPTTFFAYQNGDMYGYHDDQIELDLDVIERARSGNMDAEIRRLVEGFVLIGLPERYLSEQVVQ